MNIKCIKSQKRWSTVQWAVILGSLFKCWAFLIKVIKKINSGFKGALPQNRDSFNFQVTCWNFGRHINYTKYWSTSRGTEASHVFILLLTNCPENSTVCFIVEVNTMLSSSVLEGYWGCFWRWHDLQLPFIYTTSWTGLVFFVPPWKKKMYQDLHRYSK